MKFIMLLLAIAPVANAGDFDPHLCNIDDLQACKSCGSLAKVTSKAAPNEGEYLHAAQWNGLYAAYVHDCMAVAENLLKRGANPNWGGSSGSMIVSVSNKWPHNNKAVNQRWAALLLKFGASATNPVPGENKTPEELFQEYTATPDYPDVLALFHR